jgi:adenylate cyclase
VEFGRAPSDDGKRIVVEDRYVSRCQFRIEQVSDSSLRMDNLGQPFPLPDGAILATGESRIVSLPYKLKIGETTIKFRLERPQPPPQQMHVRDVSLQTIAQPIQFHAFRREKGDSSLGSLGASPSPEVLARWFETLLSVQRAAAGSDAFYDETARAVVDLVGLDCGLVIMRRGNGWETRAHHMIDSSKEDTFSRSIVAQVLQERRTLYRSPQSSESASLALVESVVASPVFDQDEDIVGVVYGARRNDSLITRTGITPLEAQLVQLLAAAVSAGLARRPPPHATAHASSSFSHLSWPTNWSGTRASWRGPPAKSRSSFRTSARSRGFRRSSPRGTSSASSATSWIA